MPQTPVAGIDLPTCAAISAELAEAPAARAATLRKRGLDDVRWNAAEQAWLLRIATALLQGDEALGREYDVAFAAAQDALGAGEEPRSLDEYAQLVAAIRGGADVTKALARAHLSVPAWARMQRAWTRRIAADAELERRFRELVEKSLAGR